MTSLNAGLSISRGRSPAVLADITVSGQPGHIVVVPVGTDTYSLIVVTGGSPNGERGWQLFASSGTTSRARSFSSARVTPSTSNRAPGSAAASVTTPI